MNHEPCLLLKLQKNVNSHLNEQQKRIKVKSHAVIITQKRIQIHVKSLQK